jgi:hypothetical protein
MIGVDRIAHEEEEVDGIARQDAEDRVAVGDVAACAAAAQVSAPGEAHAAGRSWRRRGDELAPHLVVVLADRITVARGGFEGPQRELAGEVAGRRDLDLLLPLASARHRRVPHDQPSPHLTARPEHRGRVGDVTYRDEEARLVRRGGNRQEEEQDEGQARRHR